MSKIINSTAHCIKTGRPYTIQFRVIDDNVLLAAGTYISSVMESNTSSDDFMSDVQMAIGDEYKLHGCPHCGNKGLYNCPSCSALICCEDVDDQKVVCPVCGCETSLSGYTNEGSLDPDDEQG